MENHRTHNFNLSKPNYSAPNLMSKEHQCRSISKTSISNSGDSEATSKPNKKPNICAISYQPFVCPILDCSSILSPSTLISHIMFHHREIPLTILLPHSSTTINISDHFIDLFTRKPSGVHGMILKTKRFGPIPFVLNICAISDIDGETKDFEDLSNQWIAIWLSTLYVLPYWFTIKLEGPGQRNCFLAYTSKPFLAHGEVTRTVLQENNNIMIVHGKILKHLYTASEGIFVTIKVHNIF